MTLTLGRKFLTQFHCLEGRSQVLVLEDFADINCLWSWVQDPGKIFFSSALEALKYHYGSFSSSVKQLLVIEAGL